MKSRKMPSPGSVKNIIYNLKDYMFPDSKIRDFNAGKSLKDAILLSEIKSSLKKQIKNCYLFDCKNCSDLKEIALKAKKITDRFVSEIPVLANMLDLDADRSVLCDPSVECKRMVISCFPGFFAILTYRIAHFFYEGGVPFLPRLLTEFAHSRTGIDINAGALIGKNFFIDHGTGIVIGETSVIGDDCRIYQGVTLGALSIKNADKSECKKRHPTLGNNVTVYANATILGGKTHIGDNSIIGGNTFIIRSVPENSKIVGQPTKTEN